MYPVYYLRAEAFVTIQEIDFEGVLGVSNRDMLIKHENSKFVFHENMWC